MSEKTKVISAFPGTGKSHLTASHDGEGAVLDSDSSDYSWVHKEDGSKERNPEFPGNYIDHIVHNIGTASLILVSTHEDVRDALVNHGIEFTLVYPDQTLKDEYLQRFRDRGSPDGFVDLMDKNWDTFIGQLQDQEGATHVQLQAGQHLSDIVQPPAQQQ
jgi:uncharacterized glyoxalase superfamily protein PhnB